ncbi:uncharacterized protein MONBRDRAFT_38957 [Monosiga brevicollis MX1]|uniref:AAA+ ATPase domain-containing protein n=1 Tax=Monosiga brevicollis TaxID=81824 RepID=A9VB62_MONBE|nr:uncharacterized protein MONBRDRAFT_38957 [Monosiga brevicollis MX1]EDQ85182.1 predicted protein [Monosiga brevicollis MX1]|eukprot:XP_001750007.1 hypothetical protein [Monosiga brevicollis MX1]
MAQSAANEGPLDRAELDIRSIAFHVSQLPIEDQNAWTRILESEAPVDNSLTAPLEDPTLNEELGTDQLRWEINLSHLATIALELNEPGWQRSVATLCEASDTTTVDARKSAVKNLRSLFQPLVSAQEGFTFVAEHCLESWILKEESYFQNRFEAWCRKDAPLHQLTTDADTGYMIEIVRLLQLDCFGLLSAKSALRDEDVESLLHALESLCNRRLPRRSGSTSDTEHSVKELRTSPLLNLDEEMQHVFENLDWSDITLWGKTFARQSQGQLSVSTRQPAQERHVDTLPTVCFVPSLTRGLMFADWREAQCKLKGKMQHIHSQHFACFKGLDSESESPNSAFDPANCSLAELLGHPRDKADEAKLLMQYFADPDEVNRRRMKEYQAAMEDFAELKRLDQLLSNPVACLQTLVDADQIDVGQTRRQTIRINVAVEPQNTSETSKLFQALKTSVQDANVAMLGILQSACFVLVYQTDDGNEKDGASWKHGLSLREKGNQASLAGPSRKLCVLAFVSEDEFCREREQGAWWAQSQGANYNAELRPYAWHELLDVLRAQRFDTLQLPSSAAACLDGHHASATLMVDLHTQTMRMCQLADASVILPMSPDAFSGTSESRPVQMTALCVRIRALKQPPSKGFRHALEALQQEAQKHPISLSNDMIAQLLDQDVEGPHSTFGSLNLRWQVSPAVHHAACERSSARLPSDALKQASGIQSSVSRGYSIAYQDMIACLDRGLNDAQPEIWLIVEAHLEELARIRRDLAPLFVSAYAVDEENLDGVIVQLQHNHLSQYWRNRRLVILSIDAGVGLADLQRLLQLLNQSPNTTSLLMYTPRLQQQLDRSSTSFVRRCRLLPDSGAQIVPFDEQPESLVTKLFTMAEGLFKAHPTEFETMVKLHAEQQGDSLQGQATAAASFPRSLEQYFDTTLEEVTCTQIVALAVDTSLPTRWPASHAVFHVYDLATDQAALENFRQALNGISPPKHVLIKNFELISWHQREQLLREVVNLQLKICLLVTQATLDPRLFTLALPHGVPIKIHEVYSRALDASCDLGVDAHCNLIRAVAHQLGTRLGQISSPGAKGLTFSPDLKALLRQRISSLDNLAETQSEQMNEVLLEGASTLLSASIELEVAVDVSVYLWLWATSPHKAAKTLQQSSEPFMLLLAASFITVQEPALQHLSYQAFLRASPIAPLCTQNVRVALYVAHVACLKLGKEVDLKPLLGYFAMNSHRSAMLCMSNVLSDNVLPLWYCYSSAKQIPASYFFAAAAQEDSAQGELFLSVQGHTATDWNSLCHRWESFAYDSQELRLVLEAGAIKPYYLLAIQSSRLLSLTAEARQDEGAWLTSTATAALLRQLKGLDFLISTYNKHTDGDGLAPIPNKLVSRLAAVKLIARRLCNAGDASALPFTSAEAVALIKIMAPADKLPADVAALLAEQDIDVSGGRGILQAALLEPGVPLPDKLGVAFVDQLIDQLERNEPCDSRPQNWLQANSLFLAYTSKNAQPANAFLEISFEGTFLKLSDKAAVRLFMWASLRACEANWENPSAGALVQTALGPSVPHVEGAQLLKAMGTASAVEEASLPSRQWWTAGVMARRIGNAKPFAVANHYWDAVLCWLSNQDTEACLSLVKDEPTCLSSLLKDQNSIPLVIQLAAKAFAEQSHDPQRTTRLLSWVAKSVKLEQNAIDAMNGIQALLCTAGASGLPSNTIKVADLVWCLFPGSACAPASWLIGDYRALRETLETFNTLQGLNYQFVGSESPSGQMALSLFAPDYANPGFRAQVYQKLELCNPPAASILVKVGKNQCVALFPGCSVPVGDGASQLKLSDELGLDDVLAQLDTDLASLQSIDEVDHFLSNQPLNVALHRGFASDLAILNASTFCRGLFFLHWLSKSSISDDDSTYVFNTTVSKMLLVLAWFHQASFDLVFMVREEWKAAIANLDGPRFDDCLSILMDRPVKPEKVDAILSKPEQDINQGGWPWLTLLDASLRPETHRKFFGTGLANYVTTVDILTAADATSLTPTFLSSCSFENYQSNADEFLTCAVKHLVAPSYLEQLDDVQMIGLAGSLAYAFHQYSLSIAARAPEENEQAFYADNIWPLLKEAEELTALMLERLHQLNQCHPLVVSLESKGMKPRQLSGQALSYDLVSKARDNKIQVYHKCGFLSVLQASAGQPAMSTQDPREKSSSKRSGTKESTEGLLIQAAPCPVLSKDLRFATAVEQPGVERLSGGHVIIFVEPLLRLTHHASPRISESFGEVSYSTVDVNASQHGFLIERHASFVNRASASTGKRTEHGTARFPCNVLEIVPLLPHDCTDIDVLQTFANFQEAWLFLDKHTGPNSLLVADRFLWHRDTSQSWIQATASSHKVEICKQLADWCEVVPEPIIQVLKHRHALEAVQMLETICKPNNRERASLKVKKLEDSGRVLISSEDCEGSSGSEFEAEETLAQAMFVALMYEEWWGEPARNLCERLAQSQTSKDDILFFDLFRQRKDDKIAFEAGDTQTIAMLLSLDFFSSKREEPELRAWVLDVLRSPIQHVSKWRILAILRKGENTASSFGLEIAPEDRLIVTTLANCCPQDSLRGTLQRCIDPVSGSQNFSELQMCLRRKDARYGVFVCKAYLHQLRNMPLIKSCIKEYVFEEMHLAPAAVYLAIIGLFDRNTHMVYVRGIRAATDLFLKWCCEYTFRFPWRFIYFEDLSIRFSFPEIRDRFQFARGSDPASESGLTRWNQRAFNLNDANEANDIPPGPAQGDKAASFKGAHWQQKVKNFFEGFMPRRVMLLVSPPGAGKSHTANEIMRDSGEIICHRFDCSDDRLVMNSLSSLLATYFSVENRPSLLVADEFHLLGLRHKRELFNWITPRLSWLNVLLIGNRKLRQDSGLLDDLRRHVQSTGCTKDDVKIEEMEVQLDPNFIVQNCHDNANGIKDDLTRWLIFLRILFGPSILSMRNGRALAENWSLVWDRYQDAESRAKNLRDCLIESLISKAPALGSEFASRCASIFVNMVCLHQTPRPDERGLSDLLLSAALKKARDSKFDSTTCHSLQDAFSNPAMQKWPPLKRASQWLEGFESNGASMKVEPCDSLFTWLDQDGFPLIVSAEEDAADSKANWLSVGIKLNDHEAQDLATLRDHVVHHRPINWSDLQKSWSSHPPSNLEQFQDLLHDVGNVLSCLTAVPDEQLVRLAERSFLAGAEEDETGFVVQHACSRIAFDTFWHVFAQSHPNFVCYVLWRRLLSSNAQDSSTTWARACDQPGVRQKLWSWLLIDGNIDLFCQARGSDLQVAEENIIKHALDFATNATASQVLVVKAMVSHQFVGRALELGAENKDYKAVLTLWKGRDASHSRWARAFRSLCEDQQGQGEDHYVSQFWDSTYWKNVAQNYETGTPWPNEADEALLNLIHNLLQRADRLRHSCDDVKGVLLEWQSSVKESKVDDHHYDIGLFD